MGRGSESRHPHEWFEIWKPFLKKRVGYDGSPFNTDIHYERGIG